MSTRTEVRRLVAVTGSEVHIAHTAHDWSPLGRRWWRLTLHCGHTADRPVIYLRPTSVRPPGRWADPPKRVRCDGCPVLP